MEVSRRTKLGARRSMSRENARLKQLVSEISLEKWC
jgi:hypothetical protein